MYAVIGADALSKTCDPTDRSTIILFGDGAGAVVVGASEEPGICRPTSTLTAVWRSAEPGSPGARW